MIPLKYKFRKAIARIRASSHNLGIELGRHSRPIPTPINERLCIYCSSNSIDDELHFVLNCQKNINERNTLLSQLPSQVISLNQHDLFIYLFNNNVEQHIRASEKFRFDSFSSRDIPQASIRNIMS